MVIVDAYNVLLAEGVGGIDLGELEEMARSSRYARRGVLLVCDGARRPDSLTRAAGASGAGVRIVTAGPGKDADSLIEHLLDVDSAPSRLLVVSNDRRIQRAARKARASWMGSGAFVRRLRDDRDRQRPAPLPSFVTDVPLDPGAVRHWLREFGVDTASSPEDVAGLPRASTRPPPPPEPPRPARPRKRDGGGAAKPKKDTGALPPGEVIDPLLLDALEEWALRPDDLDMRRWLERPDK